MNNWQSDQNFLLLLDNNINRQVYVRITNLSDHSSIEGQILNGSINVDGKSAIRRTCSISLNTSFDATEKITPDWAINFWFKLEIGLTNSINQQYDPIIWFEQGIYVATSFSVSEQPNNITINISGKDKMCLLNGELGGHLIATHDFGTVEREEDGVIHLDKVLLFDIITQALSTYSGESIDNIIINDIDEVGLELWTYLGEQPIYYFRDISDGSIDFMTIDQNVRVYRYGEWKWYNISDNRIKYYSFNNSFSVY